MDENQLDLRYSRIVLLVAGVGVGQQGEESVGGLGAALTGATERRSDRDECGRVRLNGNSNCGAAKEESECTAALVEARLSSWREHENGDISDPHLDPQKRERRWPGSKREQPSDERGLALAELLVSAIGRGWMSGAQHPIWVMKFECPKDVVIDLPLAPTTTTTNFNGSSQELGGVRRPASLFLDRL